MKERFPRKSSSFMPVPLDRPSLSQNSDETVNVHLETSGRRADAVLNRQNHQYENKSCRAYWPIGRRRVVSISSERTLRGITGIFGSQDFALRSPTLCNVFCVPDSIRQEVTK